MAKMSKHGLLLATGRVEEHYGQFMTGQVEECEGVIEKMTAKVANIDGNPDLTQGGKMRAKWGVAREALLEVGKISTRRRVKLERDLADAKSAIPTFPPFKRVAEGREVEPNLLHLQLVEIRQYLYLRKPEERELLLTEAAKAGDLDTLLAFTTAPKVMALGTPEKLTAAKDTYLRAVHSDKFEKVAAVEEALSHQDFVAATAGKLLAEQGNLSPAGLADLVTPTNANFDPIVAVAQGYAKSAA